MKLIARQTQSTPQSIAKMTQMKSKGRIKVKRDLKLPPKRRPR